MRSHGNIIVELARVLKPKELPQKLQLFCRIHDEPLVWSDVNVRLKGDKIWDIKNLLVLQNTITRHCTTFYLKGTLYPILVGLFKIIYLFILSPKYYIVFFFETLFIHRLPAGTWSINLAHKPPCKRQRWPQRARPPLARPRARWCPRSRLQGDDMQTSFTNHWSSSLQASSVRVYVCIYLFFGIFV